MSCDVFMNPSCEGELPKNLSEIISWIPDENLTFQETKPAWPSKQTQNLICPQQRGQEKKNKGSYKAGTNDLHVNKLSVFAGILKQTGASADLLQYRSEQQTAHPGAFLVLAEDFSDAHLKSRASKNISAP